MGRYNATELDAIRRDNRAMEAASVSMADELEEIFAAITDAAIGITASAADIDAACLGGYLFAVGTHSGLNFAYGAGRFHDGSAIVTVSAGTVLLTANQTNYIEVARDGTVSANISAFTAGRLPLYTAVAGASTIGTVTNRKPLYTLIGTAGITGTQLSTAAATKELTVQLGTISATTTILVSAPNVASVLAGLRIAVGTTVTTSDTDYWTIAAVNKGPAGSGTTDVLDTGAANTTKVTGGSAITANVARAATLHGTGANLVLAANDVIAITLTKSASAANLVNASLRLDFTFTA